MREPSTRPADCSCVSTRCLAASVGPDELPPDLAAALPTRCQCHRRRSSSGPSPAFSASVYAAPCEAEIQAGRCILNTRCQRIFAQIPLETPLEPWNPLLASRTHLREGSPKLDFKTGKCRSTEPGPVRISCQRLIIDYDWRLARHARVRKLTDRNARFTRCPA